MLRRYLAAIAAVAGLALLAATMPSSVTDAKELVAKRSKQATGLGASEKITVGGNKTENVSQTTRQWLIISRQRARRAKAPGKRPAARPGLTRQTTILQDM
jgi:hypothetical protein